MKKKSVGLLELETAVLECFLEKTPLSPLGVEEANVDVASLFEAIFCKGKIYMWHLSYLNMSFGGYYILNLI
jgi:hypothetical protein